ncbi:MAG: ATP-binding protein [Defluviitaleaceae bacterium]|nr:ATP-binding protein [Defluviitaleaceae bacterium]
MANIYIFRGKAAVGKSTLADMLAQKLGIPVIRKDDIVDALKMTQDTDSGIVNNKVCYNILQKIIQTNLDLRVGFIIDIALGDRGNAEFFFNRLDFKDNDVISFFITCSNEDEWRKRHEARIKDPKPHQVFTSFENVVNHYKGADVNPFDYELVIDTTGTEKEAFAMLMRRIKTKGV